MELNLKIPADILMAIRFPEKELETVLLLELAISLYQRRMLSFGKARELAKITKWEFHNELGTRKIDRHYDMESFQEDLIYAIG
ncbi:MAG: UPF0175 family protein [Leptospiraceae bacterium]|nr:UPF0175 family protein [Leptospiraceae bacterium]MCP5494561.1 UPF0175 family protein [Leptospiraceae bacterium]